MDTEELVRLANEEIIRLKDALAAERSRTIEECKAVVAQFCKHSELETALDDLKAKGDKP